MKLNLRITPLKNRLMFSFKVIPFLLFILYFSNPEKAGAQELRISGQHFELDGQPFNMWGVRVASASQKEEYTNSLIASLDEYKKNGINCISVFLQGSSGGYSDPFIKNGRSIDPLHRKRFIRIIEECAKRDMVVIAGIFYQRTVRDSALNNLNSEQAILNAVRTFANELDPYNNVIINIANEQNSSYYKGFKPFDFNDPQNIIRLCREVKKTDPNRIVGGGGYHDSSNVVIGKSEHVDVLLFDTYSGDIEKGHDSGWHYGYFKSTGVPDKPIVNVEIFGGWTGRFIPQGVYTPEGKEIHVNEIEAALKQSGLYVHFHSNTWFQGAGQGFENRFDLGGMGTSGDPGVKWYFDKIDELKHKALKDE